MIAAPTITNLSLDEIVNLESWFENYQLYFIHASFYGLSCHEAEGQKISHFKEFCK